MKRTPPDNRLNVYCQVDEHGNVLKIRRSTQVHDREDLIPVPGREVCDTLSSQPQSWRWDGTCWVRKPRVELSASFWTFIADGQDSAEITVKMPADVESVQIEVNGKPFTVGRLDAVILDSEQAGNFVVRLIDTRFWAVPDAIRVRAVEPEEQDEGNTS